MNELYRKYRPRKLSQVIGQPEAVSTLKSFLAKNKVPHVLLFSGPSGCGKTTLARIMRTKLGCHKNDYREVDAADFRGIDMVREIKSTLGLAPMGGLCKIWYVDECHKLTTDAQSALLKVLEDTPDHVYFMLATTEPERLLATIRTRATEVKVQLLDRPKMMHLLAEVMEKEDCDPAEEIREQIAERSEGSARKALVLLNQIIGLDSEEEKLSVLAKADTKAKGIQIARALISPSPQWGEVAKLLKDLEDDPETVRRIMLGYASSVLLGGGKLAPRALLLVDLFSSNFFDSGKPGLVAACYAVCRDSRK